MHRVGIEPTTSVEDEQLKLYNFERFSLGRAITEKPCLLRLATAATAATAQELSPPTYYGLIASVNYGLQVEQEKGVRNSRGSIQPRNGNN